MKIGDTNQIPAGNSQFHTVMVGCKIIMSGGAKFGISLGQNDFAGLGLTKHTLIANNIIDGTGGEASDGDGITVDAIATKTLIIGNLIHDCPGDAIAIPDTTTDTHVIGNSGWGNTRGISGAVGAILSGNNFV